MKEIIRTKKGREFVKKVKEAGKITYEEINEELRREGLLSWVFYSHLAFKSKSRAASTDGWHVKGFAASFLTGFTDVLWDLNPANKAARKWAYNFDRPNSAVSLPVRDSAVKAK